MDDFTEGVLQRAKERQRRLQELTGKDRPLKEANTVRNGPTHRKEVVSDSCLSKREKVPASLKENSSEGDVAKVEKSNSKTHISSDMPGSPMTKLKTLNIQKEDFNMEIKVSALEDVRVEVEIKEDDGTNGGDTPCLREGAKYRLQRLGKLYAGGEEADISSPIHKTEAEFHVDDSSKPDGKPNRGLRRLADLAQNINQWEDEIATPRKEGKQKDSPVKRGWKAKAPQPPVSEKNVAEDVVSDVTKEAPKALNIDRTVLEKLESQGFKRTESNTRLVYNYKNPQEAEKPETLKENVQEKPKMNEVASPSRRCPAIATRAALFEKSPGKSKDPALLSVAERKALFEKNKGAALVPKAALATAVPTESKPAAKPAESKPLKKYPAPKPPVQPKPSENVSTGIASKVAALLENKTTISQEQIESDVKRQRQKEMEQLMKRFDGNKVAANESDDEENASETTAMLKEKSAKIVKPVSPPPMPPAPQTSKMAPKRLSKGDSPKVAAVLQDVKRIKVAENKPGRLYPCLSDIETATETEAEQSASPEPDTSLEESDSANTSFGRDILQAVCKNQTPQKRSLNPDSTESDLSDILDDMDDYLDEVEAFTNAGPTPPKQGKISPPESKGTKTSNSFSYKCFSPKSKNSQPSTPKKPEDLPTHIMDGEDILPLTHTVSFYRKQQQQATSTPVRQIVRQPIVTEEDEEGMTKEDEGDVEEKIRELTEEVNKQQLVISQTSQALNLCNSTLEFTGSTEQVEAEKILLLATHRRQAALHEVQRLKVEGTLRPQGQHAQNVPLEKGTLEISDITLPLKKEYVRALAAAGGKGHHVVCLVKCGEQVAATKLVSTVVHNSKNPDLELHIPGSVILKNVYSDFTVTFEVYCLQAQEELLPHDIKYHIANKKPGVKLTPRKAKQDSRMVRPPKESPAGPQAVRSPTFALMGYVVFSIQQINKRHWSLNKVPSMSPLEGSVDMTIKCELAVSVEHRGFLTMFEDVSGFGAWHRRWCLLKGSCLSYWKYPDDERKRPPIDTIDLKSCITKDVGPVKRDVCARPHTLLLERERPAQADDKDSLTTVLKGEKTIIRHLLSADTKEERVEWCAKINAALTALRMWGKP